MTDYDYIYIIPMRGRPKVRPRVASKRAYMPKYYTDWKLALKSKLIAKRAKPMKGDVSLDIQFMFKDGRIGDIDNLAGGVMDAANGVLYIDDAQVAELRAVRYKKPAEDQIIIKVKLIGGE